MPSVKASGIWATMDHMAQRLARIPQVLDEKPYLTERQLRRWRAERRVTTFSAGGHVLFDMDDIDRYIESSRQEAVRDQSGEVAPVELVRTFRRLLAAPGHISNMHTAGWSWRASVATAASWVRGWSL